MRNPLKVLVPIGGFYPSEGGGPSQSMYWMTKSLTANGINVTIITSSRDTYKKVPCNTWLSTEYGRVRYVKTIFHFLPVQMCLLAHKEIKKHDVVHLTSMFYPLSLFVFIMCKIYSKPVVWSPRGEVDDGALKYHRQFKLFLLRKISAIKNSRLTIHTTADSETEYVRKNFSTTIPIVQIPNYMHVPQICNGKVEPVLLYLGRIHPKKNIHSIIEAVAKSELFRNSEYQLYIAGEHNNAYGKLLKEKVEQFNLTEKVKFLGHVRGGAKQRLLSECKVLLLPSVTENFGNVVVEALAQGTPVIASRGTPWQELEEAGAGYWVEANAAELLRIIEVIIKKPHEQYKLMRTRARMHVESVYDIKKKSEVWKQLYRQLASENFQNIHQSVKSVISNA